MVQVLTSVIALYFNYGTRELVNIKIMQLAFGVDVYGIQFAKNFVPQY